MHRSIIRRAVFVLAVLALLAGSFLAGSLLAGPEVAKAQAESSPVSEPNPEATWSCFLDNVAAFDNRIHVRCSTSPGGGVFYFAHPTGSTNGYTASRMLAVGQTAYALDKLVWVFYVTNPDSNPPGCSAVNCRLLTGLSMVNP